MSSSGTISVVFADTDTATTDYYNFDVGIYDGSGNTLALNTFDDSGTVTASVSSSGTYYVGVDSSSYWSSDTDDYTITATFS